MPARSLIGAAVVSAALTLAASPAGAADTPATAHAAGGDVVPPLPSLVQTRLDRLDRALDRLTDDINDADSAHAKKASKTVRRQLAAAWRGAKYYVTHAPAPPAEDRVAHRSGGVRLKDLPAPIRAKVAQDDAGPTIADPVTTAMGVFDAFHHVSGTMIELTDGAKPPVLDDLSRTLFNVLDRRDKAIADVQALAPPAPPAEDRSAIAVIAQDDAAPTFDLTMPTVIVYLDDELQHIDGLQSDATDLRPGGKRILTRASTQITATEATINTIWPPAAED